MKSRADQHKETRNDVRATKKEQAQTLEASATSAAWACHFGFYEQRNFEKEKKLANSFQSFIFVYLWKAPFFLASPKPLTISLRTNDPGFCPATPSYPSSSPPVNVAAPLHVASCKGVQCHHSMPQKIDTNVISWWQTENPKFDGKGCYFGIQMC